MISALWFYGKHSLRNRIRSQGRDVRYLAGTALFVAYFYFVIGHSTPRRAAGANGFTALVFLVLLTVVVLSSWWSEQQDHPLALNKALAQFLTPAPLTSREVMLFRLLTGLPLFLWNALVLGIISRGLSPYPVARTVAAFVGLFAIQLARVGAALARTPQQTGSAALRRIAVTIVRMWAGIAVIVALAQAAAAMAENGTFGLDKVGIPFAVAYQAPWSIFVWPYRALIAPAYAKSPPAFGSAIAIALAIVAVEAALVFQAEPQWDRIGIARTREERLNALRSKKKKRRGEASLWERYVTSLVKRPATALTWKNLIAIGAANTIRPGLFMAIGTPIVLALTLLPALRHLSSFAMGLGSAWGGMLLFIGPNFVRNDLRLDLPRIKLLRTYPLTSFEICVAEVTASTMVLLLLQYVLLILGTAALAFNPVFPLRGGRAVMYAVAIAFLLPGMTGVNILAQNIFTLAFPKWATLGIKRPTRSTNPGQYYIAMIVTLVLFALSMIVPAIGAGGAAYYLWPLGNTTAFLGGALVAGAIALAEVALIIKWMAAIFDRLDPAEVVESRA